MRKLAILAVAGMTLAGCSHYYGTPQSRVVQGAFVGSVAGGVVGGVATGSAAGVLVGAGIGAAAGAAIATTTAY